jgi:hypothetical protein
VRQRRYPELDGSTTEVWQFNRDRVSEYSDPTTGVAFTVPGVILSVQKNVMRTEGLVVEAVLGLAPSLDTYNGALQDEALRERHIANEAAELANRREELAQRVVASGSETQVNAFATVFAPDGSPAAPASNGAGPGAERCSCGHASLMLAGARSADQQVLTPAALLGPSSTPTLSIVDGVAAAPQATADVTASEALRPVGSCRAVPSTRRLARQPPIWPNRSPPRYARWATVSVTSRP